MTHTLEVVACATRIANILGLNEHLVEVIAFGHDIGHVPFGHQGEKYLALKMGQSFSHEVMGVVVAQYVERKCIGMNLTHQVLQGMVCHSGDMVKLYSHLMTQEAWVVYCSDKIAYLFADYNDFCRIGFPLKSELHRLMKHFGYNQRTRVAATTAALCVESADCGKVQFKDSDLAQCFGEIRSLMYGHYPRVTQQVLVALDPVYDFIERLEIVDPCLAIALMTDRDMEVLQKTLVLNFDHIRNTSLGELLPTLQGKTINMCNPDLDW